MSAAIFMLLAVVACGRDTPPPTSSAIPSLPQSTPPIASLPQAEQEGPFDETQGRPLVYQSKGRRDPFRLPRVLTTDIPRTMHLKLTGIIRESHSYYALVESDSSPGMGYVIRENDIVDSARVVKITKDRVVFEMQTKNPEGKLLTRYVEKHMPPAESK